MFLVWQFQFLWDLVLSARDAHIKMEAVHTKIYVKTCSVCKQNEQVSDVTNWSTWWDYAVDSLMITVIN